MSDSIFDVIKAKSNDFQSYDVTIKSRADGSLEMRSYDKEITRQRSNIEVEKKQKSILKGLETKERNKEDVSLQIIRDDSLSRTRQNIIDYACQNYKHWHSFITLTFRDMISDMDIANKYLANYVRQVKRYYPDFMYLGVPEFQKNGRAHYHLLTNLPCGSDLVPVRDDKNLYDPEKMMVKVLQYYDLPYWSYGYSSAFNIDNTDDNFNCALYITKYLYKDLDNRLWGRRKILKSNNLAKPEPVRLLSDSVEYKKALDFIKKRYTLKSNYRVEPTTDMEYIKALDIYNFQYNDSIDSNICQINAVPDTCQIDENLEF